MGGGRFFFVVNSQPESWVGCPRRGPLGARYSSAAVSKLPLVA
jgi:hypothetical protein